MKHNVMLFLSEKYEYYWFINQIHHDPIHEKQEVNSLSKKKYSSSNIIMSN